MSVTLRCTSCMLAYGSCSRCSTLTVVHDSSTCTCSSMVLTREEEQWSANIFRRGGPKRELVGGPAEQGTDDAAEIDRKLSDLQQLWHMPRIK